MSDPYSDEAARLRARVQANLREGTEPTLTPYEQFLLFGWYERELVRIEQREGRLAAKIDGNYAARLEAERASMRAVEALDRATAPGWNEPTATPLDDAEG